MFFYLSFLRPPPGQTSTSASISITPQIANDLRTEYCDASHDIFYTWSKVSTAGLVPAMRPTKLTSWRGHSSAYKEIKVPLPPGVVRDGDTWRLSMSVAPTGQRHHPSPYIDLGEMDSGLGKEPFPVTSMPILFSSRSWKAGTGKQEQIERVYRFSTHTDGDPVEISMTVTEQTSFDLDKKIWDSGIGLSSWLTKFAHMKTHSGTPGLSTNLHNALFSGETRNIIELGAGTGIVSLTLSALRSGIVRSSESREDNILTTDLPSAMPLLEHNIASNALLFSPKCRPQALVLDWDDDDLPSPILSLQAGIDAILMADVTYNTASFPALVRTLSSLVKQSATPPLIILGYKERDPEERMLWDLAEGIGIYFTKVGERPGAGGAAVEVWIGDVRS